MTGWKIPILPRSLAGQLIALSLAAIVVSQLFSLWLITDERRLALLEFAGGRVVARTATLVELLEETPPALHNQIRRAASSPLTQYWISDRPILEKSGSGRTVQRIKRSMAERFGPQREVRTQVGESIVIQRYNQRRAAAESERKRKARRLVPLSARSVCRGAGLCRACWCPLASGPSRRARTRHGHSHARLGLPGQ